MLLKYCGPCFRITKCLHFLFLFFIFFSFSGYTGACLNSPYATTCPANATLFTSSDVYRTNYSCDCKLGFTGSLSWQYSPSKGHYKWSGTCNYVAPPQYGEVFYKNVTRGDRTFNWPHVKCANGTLLHLLNTNIPAGAWPSVAFNVESRDYKGAYCDVRPCPKNASGAPYCQCNAVYKGTLRWLPTTQFDYGQWAQPNTV